MKNLMESEFWFEVLFVIMFAAALALIIKLPSVLLWINDFIQGMCNG